MALLAALIVCAVFGAFLKLHHVPGQSAPSTQSKANNENSKQSSGTVVGHTSAPLGVTVLPPVGGATKMNGIVPVGYTDDQPGAVAAATNYLTTLYGSTQILDDATRAQAIQVIAQPGAADALAASINPTVAIIKGNLLDASGKPIGGGVLTLRVLLAGYHADSVTKSSATIEIWYEAIYGVAVANSAEPVQSNYAVDTVKLVWSGDDWKWDTSSETPGPTPLGVANGSAADISRMQTVLSTFTPYTYGGAQ
jgi:hypothetical protein